jgi:MYXO-CTERM domain-containing protein
MNKNLLQCGGVLTVAAIVASSAHGNIRITEAMSSSNGNGSATPDWIEVTNFGSSAVSLANWRMDDSSFNFAVSVALSGITTIGAGESVVFIESAAGAGIASFRTFWGGLSGVQVGFYSGSGVGLSSGGDGVGLFNASNELVTQVNFGAATSGSSFFYGWTESGTLDPAYNGIVSTVGVIGTQTTVSSSGDTASIGSAIGIPAPGALALLGLAGLAGRRRR